MKRGKRGSSNSLLKQKYCGICLGRLRKSMNNLRLDVFYLLGIRTVDFQISEMHDIAVLRASLQRLHMCKKLPGILLFASITTELFFWLLCNLHLQNIYIY
jgi:hypothetical protein